MPLPHPHGNASGEIAHNSSYDTGITPGSTGGKFIGFGEQGTSAFANRPHWALSENVDHVYGVLTGDIAVPAAEAYTVSGGTGGYHQLTGDIFCGNGGYPSGSPDLEAEGLLLLFSVFDNKYNEIIDSSGYQIVVGIVRDAGNVITQYQLGFITNPTINYYKMDNAGVLQGTHTFADTTDLRIMYGLKSNLESLPVDALTKFKVQSGEENPGGMFHVDGSVPMVGDADWAGHRILNLLEARGSAGADMLLRSTQVLNLQDQYSGLIPFGQAGQTSLLGTLNTSILGAVNSNVQINKQFGGNRVLVSGGAIVFTGAGGVVTLPAGMVVDSNGESVNVGGQAISPAGTGLRWGVIDVTGTFVERSALTGVLPTDTPITYHGWDGIGTFGVQKDIRWLTNGVGSTIRMTVSDVRPDADFNNLQDPVNLIGALSYNRFTPSGAPVSYVIEVLDNVTLTSTLVLPGATVPITIRGDRVVDKTSNALSPMITPNIDGVSDVIDCNGATVMFENIAIGGWLPSIQTTGATFRNPGSHSVFRNVVVGGSTGADYGIAWGSAATEQDILIENCYFGFGTTDYAVYADGTDNISGLTMRDCFCYQSGAQLTGVQFADIDHCRFGGVSGSINQQITLGPNSEINGCYIKGGSSHAIRLGVVTLASVTSKPSYTITNCVLEVGAPGTYSGIYSNFAAIDEVLVKITKNSFFCWSPIYLQNTSMSQLGNSAFLVQGNMFSGNTGRPCVRIGTVNSIVIDSNHFTSCGGSILYTQKYSRGVFSNNVIDSWAASTTPATSAALYFDNNGDEDPEESWIVQGNIFTKTTTSSGDTAIYSEYAELTVDGNHFEAGTGGSVIDYGVYAAVGTKEIKVTNNTFVRMATDAIYMDGGLTAPPPLISGNVFIPTDGGSNSSCVHLYRCLGSVIEGNSFNGDRTDARGCMAIWMVNSPHSIIRSNSFYKLIGRRGATDHTVILVANLSHGVSISGNTFVDCGNATTSDGHLVRIIWLDFVEGCQINDNRFHDMYGPQPVGTLGYLIGVHDDGGNNNQFCGNNITESVSTAVGRICTGAHVRVKMNDQHQVCNNKFTLLGGTSYSVINTFDHIFQMTSGAAGGMFSNNHVDYWDNTSAGSALVLDMKNINCIITDNYSISANNLDCSSPGTGMALGNYIVGTGTLVLNTHQTSGNVL